ncbi:MAG: segregation/condensation protein A [Gammaproteobacteria bacterium]|nr:segregation/condensation protein A [Gammaproteobacteria bacterium]
MPTPTETTPVQTELALAYVAGQPVTELPRDLYIPPDALDVFLDTFEGPLDLLLYLIRRQNLDILAIPLADVARQYMTYVEAMKLVRLELAADYLVMAAVLAEIKSRMLLPRRQNEEDEEIDPRAELIRRLQEYEQFKNAAETLSNLPQMGRDLFAVAVDLPPGKRDQSRPEPKASLPELLDALSLVLERSKIRQHHNVEEEKLSVRERMSGILQRLDGPDFFPFESLFDPTEGRAGIVVTFIALLELVKEALLEVVQTEPYGPIHVRSVR